MSQDWTDDCFAGGHAAQTDLANMEKNFGCLKTGFSGASAPSNPLAGMWWLDTTNHLLKQRNEANDAWISWFDLSTGKLVAGASPTIDEKVKAASGDATAGYLDAKVDGSTIEVASNQLRLKDGGVTGAKLPALGAGDYILYINDDERGFSEDSYTKKKEIKIRQGGTLRIKFSLKTLNASGTVYGRIYRNGVAVGTARSTYSTSYVEYSEDIAGWSAGDLCQIYCKKGGSYSGDVKNHRIYCDAEGVLLNY